jgi:hypothetical protein
MRLFRVLRPLEWVLLLFLMGVTLKVGFSAALAGASSFAEARSREVFLGLFVVVTLQQVARTLQSRWADPQHPLRLKLLVLLPLAMLPFLIGLGTGLFDEELWARIQGELDALTVLKSMLVFLQIFGFGAPTMLLWLGLWDLARIEGQLDAALFLRRATTAVASSLRDWVPLLMLISGYAWIGEVMELSVQHGVDEPLRRIDLWIFGVDPVAALQSIISRPLSVWLAFAYSMYAVFYAICPSVIWLSSGRAAFRELALTLGTAMAVTWFSYLLFPAKGPVLSQTFSVPLDMYFIEPIKEAMMDAGRITWDCFPSMHTCASLIFWFAAWRHARVMFWVMAPIVVSIPFACVYLRYHYVIDVLAGVALALVMSWLGPKVGAAAERAALGGINIPLPSKR